MATKVRLKKSAIAGRIPGSATLDYGELAINYQDGNLYYKNADNDVKSLQESPIEFTAKNESGSSVTKGQAVYINGVSGSTPTIALADADNASAMPAFGLLKANANNNADVVIITSGNLTGLDTSSFAVGDTIYVSTTAGAITNVKPAGEASLIQNIGKVVRSHASEGIIKVGGAGRTAATPNLNSGNIFIGNDSNYASTTSMQTETRKHLVSGTGIGYDSATGVISIGQEVATTSDVQFGQLNVDSAQIGQIAFKTSWPPANVGADGHIAHTEGAIWYDPYHKNLNFYTDITHPIELGMQMVERVYNNTGTTIAKGKPLYYSGNRIDTGGQESPTVGLADATDENKYNVQGLASEDIADGEYGQIVVAGVIDHFDTSGLNAGQNFFVGLSPGVVQNAAPTYPNFPMCLGWVIKSHATEGKVIINQQNHSVNTFRVRGDTHLGADLQIDGDLTVLGTTTSVSTADLTAGTPMFRLNEGDAIGEAGTTFSGTGNDDAFFSGHFTGTASQTYYVRIDGVGTGAGGVDTFEVALGADSAFASPILTKTNMTGEDQLIHSADNISVKFAATTGHDSGDTWSGTAAPINVDTGFFSNRNTGTSGVGYTHVGFYFDISDTKWKFIDAYDSTPQGSINIADSSFSLATVAAGTFEGALVGNVNGDITGNAATSTLATNVNVTANNSTDETVYLTFVDGATGTQGIETDTSLTYNPNSNTLLVGGNVGIGTTNPVAQFAVGGAGRRIEIAGTDGVIRGYDRTSSWANIDFEAAGYTFDVSGTERMRIDGSGNVGIGTTSGFGGKLDIDLGTNARGYFSNSVSEVGSGNFALQVVNSAGSALKPLGFRAEDIRFATGSNERMRIDSDGSIDIGSTGGASSGNVILSMAGGVGTQNGTAAAPTHTFYSDPDTGMYRAAANTLAFSTGGTERMRLENSGAVIRLGGTTNAGYVDFNSSTLQLTTQRNPESGSFTNTGRAHVAIDLFDGNGTAANSYIRFNTTTSNNTTASERMRLNASGNLLVGVSSSSANMAGIELAGNGQLYASTSSASGHFLNIQGSSGNILALRSAGSTVGQITTDGGDLLIYSSAASHGGLRFGEGYIFPVNNNGATSDGAIDLGISGASRYKDLYLSGGVVLDEAYNTTVTATTTSTSQAAIASFSATTYGSAEVVVTAKDGTARHITKFLIVHTGSAASHTEYGTVQTGSSLATFDVDINGGNVRVLATPASTNSTVFNVVMTLIDA